MKWTKKSHQSYCIVTSQVRVTSDDEPHRNPVRHHRPWSITKLCNHYINCGSTRRVTQDRTSGISWCRACCLFVAWWSLMFWWFAGKNYEDFCLRVAPCQELDVWRLRRVCLNESSDSWNAKRTPAKILDSEKITLLASIGDEGMCESCHFASTPFSKSPHFVCWLLLCDSYSSILLAGLIPAKNANKHQVCFNLLIFSGPKPNESSFMKCEANTG